MEREGVKDAVVSRAELERVKYSEGTRTLLSLKKTKSDMESNSVETTSVKTLESDDVKQVRHPHPDVLRKRHPSKSRLQLRSGHEGVGIMG